MGTQPRDLLIAWLSFLAGDFCKRDGGENQNVSVRVSASPRWVSCISFSSGFLDYIYNLGQESLRHGFIDGFGWKLTQDECSFIWCWLLWGPLAWPRQKQLWHSWYPWHCWHRYRKPIMLSLRQYEHSTGWKTGQRNNNTFMVSIFHYYYYFF